jgi:hypothetical protein
LHVHHRISRGLGGEDTMDNAITICDKEHRKLELTVQQFYQLLFSKAISDNKLLSVEKQIQKQQIPLSEAPPTLQNTAVVEIDELIRLAHEKYDKMDSDWTRVKNMKTETYEDARDAFIAMSKHKDLRIDLLQSMIRVYEALLSRAEQRSQK